MDRLSSLKDSVSKRVSTLPSLPSLPGRGGSSAPEPRPISSLKDPSSFPAPPKRRPGLDARPPTSDGVVSPRAREKSISPVKKSFDEDEAGGLRRIASRQRVGSDASLGEGGRISSRRRVGSDASVRSEEGSGLRRINSRQRFGEDSYGEEVEPERERERPSALRRISTSERRLPPPPANGFIGSGGSGMGGSGPVPGGLSSPTFGAGAAPPKLPPRLPPRTSSISSPTFASPTSPLSSSPPRRVVKMEPREEKSGYINQGSLDRIARHGISIPSLGIGSNSNNSESPLSSPTKTTSPSKYGSRPAPPPPNAPSYKDARKAAGTFAAAKKDPGSVSMKDGLSAFRTAREVQKVHGEDIKRGYGAARDIQEKHGDDIKRGYGAAKDLNERHGDDFKRGYGAARDIQEKHGEDIKRGYGAARDVQEKHHEEINRGFSLAKRASQSSPFQKSLSISSNFTNPTPNYTTDSAPLRALPPAPAPSPFTDRHRSTSDDYSEPQALAKDVENLSLAAAAAAKKKPPPPPKPRGFRSASTSSTAGNAPPPVNFGSRPGV